PAALARGGATPLLRPSPALSTAPRRRLSSLRVRERPGRGHDGPSRGADRRPPLAARATPLFRRDRRRPRPPPPRRAPSPVRWRQGLVAGKRARPEGAPPRASRGGA